MTNYTTLACRVNNALRGYGSFAMNVKFAANELSRLIKVSTGHPRRSRVFDDGIDPLSRLLHIHFTGQDRLQRRPDNGFPVGQIAKTIKMTALG